MKKFSILFFLTVSVFLSTATSPVYSAKPQMDNLDNKRIFRFEADNDSLWDRDSHFTSGWSMQYHSLIYNSWNDAKVPEAIRWIGRHVPTLNRSDSHVRVGFGLGQMTFTPGDLTLSEREGTDLPYAGTLTTSLSWQSFNRNSSRTFQISLGLLGKESLAGQFHIYSHNDLYMGEDPKGWDDQRETEPIVNFAYAYRQNLYRNDIFSDSWGSQLSLEAAASLGNLATDMTLSAGFRTGWNLLEGFTMTAAPAGIGLVRASHYPKPAAASPHSIELVLGVSISALIYSVIYDGSLISSDERDVNRKDYMLAGTIGINYHYKNKMAVGLHFNKSSDLIEEDSLPTRPLVTDRTRSDPSYAALIIDYYF